MDRMAGLGGILECGGSTPLFKELVYASGRWNKAERLGVPPRRRDKAVSSDRTPKLRREHRIIVPLTVKDILDEEIARKLA